MSVALALDEERLTLDQYRESLEDGSPLKHLHDVVYPAAMERAGVERLDLDDALPAPDGIVRLQPWVIPHLARRPSCRSGIVTATSSSTATSRPPRPGSYASIRSEC